MLFPFSMSANCLIEGSSAAETTTLRSVVSVDGDLAGAISSEPAPGALVSRQATLSSITSTVLRNAMLFPRQRRLEASLSSKAMLQQHHLPCLMKGNTAFETMTLRSVTPVEGDAAGAVLLEPTSRVLVPRQAKISSITLTVL